MSWFWYLRSLVGYGPVTVINQQRKEKDEEQRRYEECATRIKAHKEAEIEKINRNIHLLTGKSWRCPEGKQAFVEAMYDGVVPEYLWYAIGKLQPSEQELRELNVFFWGEQDQRFGDWERHESVFQEVGQTLRIRKPKNFAAEINFGGKKCPLHQVGYSFIGVSWGGPCFHFSAIYQRIDELKHSVV